MEKFLIDENSSLSVAINKLDDITEFKEYTLFVTDCKNRIIGSLTDGDIRRSLIKFKTFDIKVSQIMNKKFHYIRQTKGYISFSEYKNKPFEILPILDDKEQLVDIVNLKNQKCVLPLECVIMAGGRGKRLSPLTDTIPKPMLPLGNKPIIEHNIDKLISYGVKKIYISVKYLGKQIEEYFGNGSKKGIEIKYIWEDKALGTAGALSLIEEFDSDHILLMNSDLFTNIDFESLYKRLIIEKADMVVASTEYKIDIPYAIFEIEGRKVLDFKEKPTYIYQANAGCYILKKELINKIPKNKFYNITELMEELVKGGGKLVFDPILGYWIDIGKPLDYIRAQDFVKHFN